jgi:hypothetical protein
VGSSPTGGTQLNKMERGNMAKNVKMAPRNPEMGKCQMVPGTAIQRAIHNEVMAVEHQPSRCSEHNLFHNWITPIDPVIHGEKRSKAAHARTFGFFKIRSGRYLPETLKKEKKEKKD